MASYRRFKPRIARPIEDPRAARVSILWNENEAQIIRVLEAA